jgi:hypothetical protein
MFRNSLLSGIMPRAIARWLAAGLLAISFAALLPAAAQANNLFSIDSHATSTGPIVTDSSGTGYVAWNRSGSEVEQPIFCKIPRGGTCTDPIELQLPIQSPQSDDGVDQPFPVLGGAPGVVYVVGPRYSRDDTLIWTSTDGGESFSVKEIPTGSFSDELGVGDVLYDPNFDAAFPATTDETFAIAGEDKNIGYGYTSNIASESTPTSFQFAGPGEDAQGVTLGFSTNAAENPATHHAVLAPVEAYWTDSEPYLVRFYRYANKGGLESEASGWEGPSTVTDGYEPRLAGGPDGLFMLSTDLAPGAPEGEQPSVVDVRKYNETTHEFEAPKTIANIPTSTGTLFTSGDIFENSVTGTLYVAQPIANGGEYVMRLWESTDGGQTFHGERDIAKIGYGYSGIPRLAVAEDGQGWLTFKDYGGLEVADLNALPAAPVSGSSKPTTPTPTPTPAVSSLAIPNQTDEVNGKGDLSISVDCIGAKCTGSLTLLAKYKKTTGKGKKKKTKIVVQTIGSASFNSLDLGVDTMSVKLNAKGKSLLILGGYKLSSTASASYLSGSVFKTATGTAKLKGHKPSKKAIVLKKIKP